MATTEKQSAISNSTAWLRIGTVFATRLLPLLLLLALPAVVQAQFNYTTNNGTITITKYNGSGGAVTIPDTINGLPVTSIGYWAFSSCTSLTNVTIPSSVASIGNWAFTSCSSLAAITVDALNSVYSSGDGVLFNKSQTMLIECPSGKAGSYMIPNSVTEIGDYALAWCARLTNVTIPNSVTSIGHRAFYSCTSLTSVRISNAVTWIGDSAFAECTSLTGVTIPNSVTYIGGAAFQDCVSLTSVRISDSIRSIGDRTFGGCTSLTNLSIPSSVTNIGFQAFSRCTSLTSAIMGNNVISIGEYAFAECASLTSITIPSSVTSIGNWAFSWSSLRGVYSKGNAPSAFSTTFYYNDATIYYLPGTTGWGPTFAGRPTRLWKPQVQTGDASFGVKTNRFGFNIAWASGQIVVVDACTDLVNPTWFPLLTNTLSGDSSFFSDPQWTNHPARFYRLRSP